MNRVYDVEASMLEHVVVRNDSLFGGRRQTVPTSETDHCSGKLEFALAFIRSLGDQPISVIPTSAGYPRSFLVVTEPLKAEPTPEEVSEAVESLDRIVANLYGVNLERDYRKYLPELSVLREKLGAVIAAGAKSAVREPSVIPLVRAFQGKNVHGMTDEEQRQASYKR
jgi:hypothetical protein